MSPEQKALVKKTWQQVAPMADAAARLFYDRLFEIDATTRQLFKTTDLTEQRRKLIQALTMVVRGLDHLEAVGAVLLWPLKQFMGSGWWAEVIGAWSSAYPLLADIMRAAAVRSAAS